MSLLPFIEWSNDTTIAVAIRNSLWMFPALQVFHLVALAVLGGSVLVVDLRLLGVGLRTTPVSKLAADLAPWMTGSLALIAISGVGMFLSGALLYYYNAIFIAKIVLFIIALAFTYGVRVRWTRGDSPARGAKVVAGVSIALWTLVAAAGRGVGFW